ncbi:MAG: hypothetical protein ACD_59C00120G0006 [uncultured bacterium]|nr:MAG: hypothetical protein ACD_59C00120G0006 [uncultured bacterium]
MNNDIYYQYNPWREEYYNPNKYIARPCWLGPHAVIKLFYKFKQDYDVLQNCSCNIT